MSAAPTNEKTTRERLMRTCFQSRRHSRLTPPGKRMITNPWVSRLIADLRRDIRAMAASRLTLC